jgi:hypothetical protein
MTKQDALAKTQMRFTNLMDGKVVSNVAVKTIIDYYEGLIKDEPIEVKTTSNFVQNFREDDIDFITDSEF